jgi:hypothetical protein
MDEFIKLVDALVPLELKQWVSTFEKKENRKVDMYDLYRLSPISLGSVHFAGFPPSKIEIENKENSLSNQILKKLRERYTEDEIKKQICEKLRVSNRHSTPVYVITLLYLIPDLLEKDHCIFEAMCEAIFNYNDMIWGEIVFGLLRHQTTNEEEIVDYAIKLLKSEKYKHRSMGHELLYCTDYLVKGERVTQIIDAYKQAYAYELNEKTKSPYKTMKERYTKKIAELTKRLTSRCK